MRPWQLDCGRSSAPDIYPLLRTQDIHTLSRNCPMFRLQGESTSYPFFNAFRWEFPRSFLYWDAIKLTNTLEMFIHIEVYNVLSTRRIRSPLPYMPGWLPHHASLKLELVPHCPERTSRKLFISLSVL
ncbi:predicted protein [Coccidioides posadasii str. Silveira]|uniref:Predicted protein n=2 Tax=Coccidioides posadasii TaxID=199306 RepID=E9CTS0_COCPS|nr:predicted protein [Coccidioides posadasii str. Silveira]KMM67197.1 hypothetical protein CPAG_03532 [Coccidioides posadasii RMSCC 3488]